ncbi:CD276 antigen [Hoplias malabaricus]|uniref:CD276 antigen n=1 Tax=Hoplias malabaricus TaxID=27720 RepID=UPI003461F98E
MISRLGANVYWVALLIFTFIFLSIPCEGSLTVIIPASRVVAVRGQPVVLGCRFTPDPGSDISSLVLTWQINGAKNKVVHSFYYKKDQLELQSKEYKNRTSLFISELGKGNASLRIMDVGLNDEDRYQCVVSTSAGTDRGEVQLEYGAFYTEPRLSIKSSTNKVTMLYEAEGFPKPEVRWLGEQGEILSANTELLEGTNGEEGLYFLRSSYVASSPVFNITFILKNQLLNQDLQIPVCFSHVDDPSNGAAVPVLAITCVVLAIALAVVSYFYYKKKK